MKLDGASFANAVAHAAERISAAELVQEPFPHIYVEQVFPDDFYAQMRAHLPARDTYVPLRDTGRVGIGYSSERLVLLPNSASLQSLAPHLAAFWHGLFSNLLTENFAHAVMTRFADPIAARFVASGSVADQEIFVTWESFLIRDRARYSLGPHTDSPKKLVSMLFYLADEHADPELGTSLYAPREPGFECNGGPHYDFEGFERLRTMAYAANCLFAFPKSNRCFHGVEPVADAMERDLLFFYLRNDEAPKQS